MDSIFGRKKRTRAPTGEILTSSGAGGHSVAEVVGNSMQPRMNISTPKANGGGDHHQAYPVQYRIEGEEFGPRGTISPSSTHRRLPSTASSTTKSMRPIPTDYASSGAEQVYHQSRYPAANMQVPGPDSGSSRYPTMTSEILNRMSISSAASASIGMAPGGRHPSNESRYYPQTHLPRDSSSTSGFSRTSGGPVPVSGENKAEFILMRPEDADVERMFADLMNKRDFLGQNAGSLSDTYKEAAIKNMMNFSVDKKWTLVYNDKYTEYLADKERERTRKNNYPGPQGNSQGAGLAIARNSPEWYIKKFMDGSVTSKHIESLAVTLRTCAMGWVESFVDAKGTPVLASFLSGLHSKGINKTETDISLEYETLKAFRSLFNSKAGASDAFRQPKCVNSIVHSIISSHLATRKQAADILLFLCHWSIPDGHKLVLRGFDELKSSLGDHGRFDAWFRVLEQTIDGRGQMGSKVGQSEEVRKLSMLGYQEASLNEYALNNMFLINAVLSQRIVQEDEVRVHLRNQMDASGLQRILIKLRAFKNSDLDRQLDEFEGNAERDQEFIFEKFNKDVLTDMSDPVDVFKAIVHKISGTRAYDFFLSGLQHLLLIKQDGEPLNHYYHLFESLVAAVVLDKKGSVEGNDMSGLLGVSVNSVLSRFADVDAMNATREELQKTKTQARQAQQRITELEDTVNQSSDGLVGELQKKIEAMQNDLDVARGNASATQRDMEEMEQAYMDRIVAMEVENREVYQMLKEAQGTAQMASTNGNMDRQKLVESLEKQMERSKTIRKLEANARKHGIQGKMTKEEESAFRKEERRQSRKRASRKSLRADRAADEQAVEDQSQSEDDSESDSELDPQTEAGKWKIQATLAAGMAKNADLQSRMTDAKSTRRRKGSRGSQTKGSDAISSLDAGEGAPPPPPPPPPPQMDGNAPATFLDEIRKRKGAGLRSASSGSASSGDMGPPPPPPPPPPMPPGHGVQASAFSTSGSSRPDSFASDAPPPPAPPPPPTITPGGVAQISAATRDLSPSSNAINGSAESTPALNRNSMLNVRASFHGQTGPVGPAHAPPAPPVGFFAANMVQRKDVQDVAKVRMKQLQWDKLSPQHAQETIWGQSFIEEKQLSELLREQGLFEEMEEDFKAKQIAKRATQATKKDKVEFKTHLPLQTRQGIEMVLRRVKSSLTDAKHATPEEVAHHIVNCNEAVLDQSFLAELLRHYPESETKGQLGEYRNASDEELRLLHPADRLVVLLMTVPHLKDKVKGLLFLTKYREAYEIIKEGAVRIREGSEALVQAQNFAKLLNLILMMGNFLNSNGMQGGAFGFKISSINKLVDTKASDNTTLLHFVERTINRCFPDVEAFLDELEKPSEACRVQLLDLRRDLAELKSGSLQHKKELDRFLDESEDRLEDPYTKLMLPFLNEVHGELSRLSDQVQFSERTYIEALRFFGEGPDPKRRGFPAPQPMRTEDFFGIFREFQTAYRKVKIDNVQISEMRNAEAKRRAAAEERERERQEAIKRKEAGVDDSAVLETLLGNLRNGGITPKRKRNAREKAQQRSAQGRDGARASSNAEGSGGEAPNVPTSSSIDGNPSDVAQAMLAKLQGGNGSATGHSESRASMSFPNRRRRERRPTIVPSNSPTTAMREGLSANTPKSHDKSFSDHGISSPRDAPEDHSSSVPDMPSRRSQRSTDNSELDEGTHSHNRSRSSLSDGSQYSAPADAFVAARNGSHHGDGEGSGDTEGEIEEPLPAAERLSVLNGSDFRQRALQDDIALRRDHSAEFAIGQGEWFDPDGSGFMNTSIGSPVRTARPRDG